MHASSDGTVTVNLFTRILLDFAKVLPFFLEAPDILLSGFKYIVFRFHNLQGKFYLPVSI